MANTPEQMRKVLAEKAKKDERLEEISQELKQRVTPEIRRNDEPNIDRVKNQEDAAY